MNQIKTLRELSGPTFFIMSSTMGAGILALPVMTGLAGFSWGLVAICIGWIMMISTGIIIARQDILQKKDADLLSLYHHFFGNSGKIFASFVYLFLFYGLLAAYLSAIGTIINQLFPASSISILMHVLPVAILIGVVAMGTKIVYKFATLFILLLLFSFFILIFKTVPAINLQRLHYSHSLFLIIALPSVICGYGFHNTIPTVFKTLEGNQRKIITAILLGTLISFAISFLLLFIASTTLPIINHSNSQVSLLYTFNHGFPITVPLGKLLHSKTFGILTLVFTLLAMVCSFLVVGTCLMNFLKDLFSGSKYNSSIFMLVATFLLPVIITLIAKNLFLMFINIAAGIGATILFGIMPCIIGMKKYHFYIKLICFIILCMFVVVLGVEAMQQLHLIHILPV